MIKQITEAELRYRKTLANENVDQNRAIRAIGKSSFRNHREIKEIKRWIRKQERKQKNG